MPRIPRLGRGEQNAPAEATDAEQAQQLTSGDPLATPSPPKAAEAPAPIPHALTSGDPLAGASAPAEATPAEQPEVAPAPEATSAEPEAAPSAEAPPVEPEATP